MRYGMRGLGVLTVVCLVAVWLWSVGAARQESAERAAAAPGGAAATPRMPNGRPDFNGRWGGGGGGGRKPVIDANGNINMFGNYRKGNPTNGERDSGLEQRFGPNFPLYKPNTGTRSIISTTMATSRTPPSTACRAACRASDRR
jgi:hypothetical protein